ncbi:MAG: hypothetical protein HYW13_01895 [Planctomycetes bacterium]|nr:hypothetical protein [Planctomycetota bacterium]
MIYLRISRMPYESFLYGRENDDEDAQKSCECYLGFQAGKDIGNHRFRRLHSIATYSLDTRWFTAVAATLMMAFITQLYGFNVVVPYIFITSLVIFLSVSIFEIVRAVCSIEIS